MPATTSAKCRVEDGYARPTAALRARGASWMGGAAARGEVPTLRLELAGGYLWSLPSPIRAGQLAMAWADVPPPVVSRHFLATRSLQFAAGDTFGRTGPSRGESMVRTMGRTTHGRVTVGAEGRRQSWTWPEDRRVAEEEWRSDEPDFLSVKFQTGAAADHCGLAPTVLA